MQVHELRAWCPSCRRQVELSNLRSWPEGVLIIGDCPDCKVAVASRKPIGWMANGNGAGVARTSRAE